jgi:hypothetical protein
MIAKNAFWPLFCHFLRNLVILRPPVFSAMEFLGACLFGRKFGHLATVNMSSQIGRLDDYSIFTSLTVPKKLCMEKAVTRCTSEVFHFYIG